MAEEQTVPRTVESLVMEVEGRRKCLHGEVVGRLRRAPLGSPRQKRRPPGEVSITLKHE